MGSTRAPIITVGGGIKPAGLDLDFEGSWGIGTDTYEIKATPLTSTNQVNLPQLKTKTRMDPTLGILSMGMSFFGGLMQSKRARQAQQDALSQQRYMEKQITDLENSRGEVINPYANMKDLSGMIRNPYANLQVATRAAELKAEETDLSLANTLDTLRATGSGAGGATALATAAMRSKLNIAAGIEQQEAQNTRMRAQGEFQMDQLKMREAMRLQNAEAQGKAFMFQGQERRDMQKLNRLSAMAGGYAQQAAGYGQQASAGMGQALGSLTGLGYSLLNKP